jgi:hypothetical protein
MRTFGYADQPFACFRQDLNGVQYWFYDIAHKFIRTVPDAKAR